MASRSRLQVDESAVHEVGDQFVDVARRHCPVDVEGVDHNVDEVIPGRFVLEAVPDRAPRRR